MLPSHTSTALSLWNTIQYSKKESRDVIVDGQTLSLADVIAVAYYGAPAKLSEDNGIRERLDDSVKTLNNCLRQQHVIYGVNTGFGGSADVRTADLEDLQKGLVQHLNVGILLPSDKGDELADEKCDQMQTKKSFALPDAAVRAMMLVRCNSLMRGHSGVRLRVMNNLLALLRMDAIPVVPLRGSISASGDLSSLSYLAGMLEGNPGIYVKMGDASAKRQVVPASEALRTLGMEPVRLQAKEGLGITNGTAASTAAAALAMHQAHRLAFLTQILTAMATEALLGTRGSFDPFISQCRPHPGQKEAARNIMGFLLGSKLATDKDSQVIGLAQDRYALRTASQWIGPQLENLVLAHQQVETEINSTTDNPLIDPYSQSIHHGGNFQAASITCAMEKVTSTLQHFGRLLFAQCSELLNSNMTTLPPNLCADDPSKSFTMKGFDVNMAAYMSELAYIAHPISVHVQSAEMHNQSINSMALVAARIALECSDILTLMAATYLYVLCQALDLRCLQLEFQKQAEIALRPLLNNVFGSLFTSSEQQAINEEVWPIIYKNWLALASLDLAERGAQTVKNFAGDFLVIVHRHWAMENRDDFNGVVTLINRYCQVAADTLTELYSSVRDSFFECPTTIKYLSSTSAAIYEFVRTDLDVPMHRGLSDHPVFEDTLEGKNKQHRTLGSMASAIYVALQSGSLHDAAFNAAVAAGLSRWSKEENSLAIATASKTWEASSSAGSAHSPGETSTSSSAVETCPSTCSDTCSLSTELFNLVASRTGNSISELLSMKQTSFSDLGVNCGMAASILLDFYKSTAVQLPATFFDEYTTPADAQHILNVGKWNTVKQDQ
ncbi:hypothetical protein NLG97_g330 [Lecanicillium saksenae]|uniref:Uncharacterized protein n=1 Tax=Lecanicillium saksenae TaxID=468837 RepID=A0ACC1R857_9HYPO|nr:hypothetical protein NLG97_g330 [Lecanicillium saksenae]